MSWRLWHLQNLMVDTDNAKSKREFRKLSKCMGDKLDKEKGRYVTPYNTSPRHNALIPQLSGALRSFKHRVSNVTIPQN